jgi:hypothetical protein
VGVDELDTVGKGRGAKTEGTFDDLGFAATLDIYRPASVPQERQHSWATGFDNGAKDPDRSGRAPKHDQLFAADAFDAHSR